MHRCCFSFIGTPPPRPPHTRHHTHTHLNKQPQGRLTLLLSPPGAGKSVLLRALAGALGRAPGLRVRGEVTYNGRAASDCAVARSVAYVSQNDVHTPTLSVEQTVAFAAECARKDGFGVSPSCIYLPPLLPFPLLPALSRCLSCRLLS